MSEYDLRHIIQECMDEKANVASTARGHTAGARVEIYSESWNSLNLWIESKLSRRKGVEVPMLGKFSWEFKQSGGEWQCRPIFIISESFVKEHHVRRQRTHHVPLISPCEDINYSKLAIKFSKSLTKDMVFSGTRDILKKIGDYIDRMYDFSIEFSFGTFRSKERQCKFEFNMARMNEIMPESTAGLYTPSMPSTATAPRGRTTSAAGEGNQGSKVVDSTVGAGASTGAFEDWGQGWEGRDGSPDPATTARSAYSLPFMTIQPSSNQPLHHRPTTSISLVDRGNSKSASNSSAADSNTSNSQNKVPPLPLIQMNQVPTTITPFTNTSSNINTNLQVVVPESSKIIEIESPSSSSSKLSGTETYLNKLSPRSAELMVSLMDMGEVPAATKVEQRNKARERVTQAAYLRCVDEVGVMAKVTDTVNDISATRNDFQTQLDASKKTTMKDGIKELRTTLNKQIFELELRRKKEKDDMRAAEAAFFLNTNSESLIPPPGSVKFNGGRDQLKKELKNDLVKQITTNAERQRNMQAQARNEECRYLDYVAMEMDLQDIQDRAKHLDKQRQLLESWERDGHIRNLKKLQEKGPIAVSEYIYRNLPDAMPSSRSTNTMGMGIGYDPRKGTYTK